MMINVAHEDRIAAAIRKVRPHRIRLHLRHILQLSASDFRPEMRNLRSIQFRSINPPAEPSPCGGRERHFALSCANLSDHISRPPVHQIPESFRLVVVMVESDQNQSWNQKKPRTKNPAHASFLVAVRRTGYRRVSG